MPGAGAIHSINCAAMASMFDAHWHGFRVFGGVPGRGIYDNMKTAVDRVGRGKERQINLRFLAMTNHYAYEPEFCNPAAGWVEPVRRHRFKTTCEGAGRVERLGCSSPDAARNAGLPRSRCAECLAGRALPRTLAADPAWQTARHDCRCLGRGANRADAAARRVRRLHRVEQARLTSLSDQF